MKKYEKIPPHYTRKDFPIILFVIFFTLLLVVAVQTQAQKYQLAVFGGVANYQGDLKPVVFTFEQSRPAVHVVGKLALNDHFIIRAGYAYASVYADDRYNRDYLKPRNLNFRSSLHELHAGIEYNLFSLETKKITPYVFAGVGVFKYNPYTYENNQKVFLQPLGTEGQGLAAYPERKLYQLTQLCLPIGYGIKYKVNCNLTMSFEFSQRKLFTDYFDDISSSYADPAVIAAARGPQAARLSWRGDEVPGGSTNAPVGGVRGNPSEKDWYYFVGTTAHINLVNCQTDEFVLKSLFKKLGFKKRNNSIAKCPRVLL